MRLIDADSLYTAMQDAEELARKRVLDTESTTPYPHNINPAYTRYVAQMDERTRAKEMIADAPSAQQWIPITERLPDVRQWVLCQCRAGIMDVLRLTANGSWNKNYPHTEYMSGFVIAWMPLPEPWKGEADG